MEMHRAKQENTVCTCVRLCVFTHLRVCVSTDVWVCLHDKCWPLLAIALPSPPSSSCPSPLLTWDLQEKQS